MGELSIEKHRDEIISSIFMNTVVVIKGDTGSGKTTKIPQYIYDSNYFKKKSILITQPKRVAVLNLAKEVARQMNLELGQVVGYVTRFE